MTLAAVTWAWEQTGLSPAEKLLLLALADMSTDHGSDPDPGRAFSLCELDTAEGQELLASLAERGLVDGTYRTIER